MGEFARRRVENELEWRHEAPRLLAAYESLWHAPSRPADPGACRCPSIGTEAQHQAYQRYTIAKPTAGRGGGAPERRVLVDQQPDGRYYVWPDARICRCLYVGDESRYQAYVRLGLEQKTRAGARDRTTPL